MFIAILLDISSRRTCTSGSRRSNAVVISPLPLVTCLAEGMLALLMPALLVACYSRVRVVLVHNSR